MEVTASLTAKVPLSEVRGSKTSGKNIPGSASSSRRTGGGKQTAPAPPSTGSSQGTQSTQDPDASAVVQVGPPQGRGKGKTVGGAARRDSPLGVLRRNRRMSSHESQEGDDDEDSPDVSSRSRSHRNGAVSWPERRYEMRACLARSIS